MKQNIPNYGILNPIPSDPAGYITKDESWCAVPCENKFIIIHNGKQVHTANSYDTAKKYISKQVKQLKKQTSTLEQFL